MENNIFTNVYGLGRSLLAMSLFLDLSFTHSFVYFPEFVFNSGADNSLVIPNFFLIFGSQNLNITVGIAIFTMIWVISGYTPQITGILHAWMAYSFFTGSIMIEGGNQIAQIITILLIPVTLFDKRINHWAKTEFFSYNRPPAIEYFCKSCLMIIGVQMSIVYFFAVAVKVNTSVWQNGSAIYYWFNDSIFGLPEAFRSFLYPLTSSRIFSPLMTWSVLILEAILFAALFMSQERKKILLPIGLIFHFMIILCHGLWSFFFAMAGGLVIYLYPSYEYISFRYLRSIGFSFQKQDRKKQVI
ncbi:hypothetical protein [Sphingobacterium multivorum]|uniref:HTTM-like domain-containing protein n=1 Tax=Sphingobacterium multivorum TaxID=28454 RepID=A0ABX7CT32_SPHMU|nr:hypothetical protein [Sphingobacterium multivorum]QQT55242.1 hypothetical protein I6I98_08310 [Sphingobacterium multivorum]